MMKNSGLKTAWFKLLDSDRDPLSVISKIFRRQFLRDRFDILNHYSPFRVSSETDEIPLKYDVCPKFSDLLDERASELLSKYHIIAVAWSGGVDSTSVVVSLLRALPPLDYWRIKVVGTAASIAEAPEFYQLMNRIGLNVTIADELVDGLGEVECDAIVSGWCADQLFGSDVHLKNLDLYNKHWLDAIDWHLQLHRQKLSTKSKDILADIYTQYADALGVKVEQWCEFAWMFNFGVKYSYIRDHSKLCLAGSENVNKVFPFFDTMKFQRYGLNFFESVRDENIYANSEAYKREMKQYIYSFTGDKDYLLNKGKVGSWRSGSRSSYARNIVPVVTDSGLLLFKCTSHNNPRDVVANTFRKEDE